MSKDSENKDQEDKFTYSEEDINALKFFKSKEHVENEDRKAGKKTIWYED